MLKTYKIAKKVYLSQDHSVSAYTDTDYKHVFFSLTLMNY